MPGAERCRRIVRTGFRAGRPGFLGLTVRRLRRSVLTAHEAPYRGRWGRLVVPLGLPVLAFNVFGGTKKVETSTFMTPANSPSVTIVMLCQAPSSLR